MQLAELKPGKDYVGVGIGVMVRNEKGEFLLGFRTKNSRNEPGKWTFPGGCLEFGETWENCAVREAKEEAGIEVEPIKIIRVINHILKEEEQHWFNPIIEARIVKGSPAPVEPHKMSKWQWFSLENMPENITINLVEFFSDIKSGKINLE